MGTRSDYLQKLLASAKPKQNMSSELDNIEPEVMNKIVDEFKNEGIDVYTAMQQEKTPEAMNDPNSEITKMYRHHFRQKYPDQDTDPPNTSARQYSDKSIELSKEMQKPVSDLELPQLQPPQMLNQPPQVSAQPIQPTEPPPIENQPPTESTKYDELLKLYKTESDKGEKEIAEAKDKRFYADIIGALTGLGQNVSLAYAGKTADKGVTDSITRMGERSVDEAKESLKTRLTGLKEQLNILKVKSNSTYLLNKSTLKGTANDPNSKESIEYAKSLGKLYPDLAPSFKGQPKEILQKYANQFVGRVPTVFEKEKLEASQNLRNKELAGRQGRSKDHQKMAAIKRIEDKADLLSGLKGVRSNYAQNEKRLILAEDGMRIIESVKKGKFLPTKQVGEELATVLASTLQGGNAASQGMVKNLIPETLWGDFKGAKQYLMNKPQSSISHDFLDQFEKQLAGQYDFYKEKNAVIKKQAEESLKPYFDKYPDLKESFNAQTALDIRNQYENDISSGTYPINRGVDPAIDKYAKEHGFDYDKAKKLLTQRGYKPKE